MSLRHATSANRALFCNTQRVTPPPNQRVPAWVPAWDSSFRDRMRLLIVWFAVTALTFFWIPKVWWGLSIRIQFPVGIACLLVGLVAGLRGRESNRLVRVAPFAVLGFLYAYIAACYPLEPGQSAWVILAACATLTPGPLIIGFAVMWYGEDWGRYRRAQRAKS